MSARARRAQQRANTVPSAIPPPPCAAQRELNPRLSNVEKYDDDYKFTAMLRGIGINHTVFEQLNSDDFDTMKVLVDQYKDDVSEFASYLKTINKSSSPVQFSPVVSNQITAVLHFYIQSITSFHTIPDISVIDRDEATVLVEAYNAYLKFWDIDADEDVIINLLDLKGHDNWIQYCDKFLSNLSNMVGTNGTPLPYIIDNTERVIMTSNHPYNQVPTINLESWDTYREQMIHFGAHFKRDNTKVWQLLKKSLLRSQPYHHINQ